MKTSWSREKRTAEKGVEVFDQQVEGWIDMQAEADNVQSVSDPRLHTNSSRSSSQRCL